MIAGRTKPYILNGVLGIPFNADRKYKWWLSDAMTIDQILDDIDAPEEVKEKYRNHAYDEDSNLPIHIKIVKDE